jgi:hypothetical protein
LLAAKGGQPQVGRVPAGPRVVRKRCRVGTEQLALQLELCLPRLVSSPAPGGSIDGLRAFSRNPGRRASKTILRRLVSRVSGRQPGHRRKSRRSSLRVRPPGRSLLDSLIARWL